MVKCLFFFPSRVPNGVLQFLKCIHSFEFFLDSLKFVVALVTDS